MERYIERIVGRKRRTNLKVVLRRHGIKQYELAQAADMDTWLISAVCTGRKIDMKLSTAMRICNALNDILESDKMMYNLHDLFGEQNI